MRTIAAVAFVSFFAIAACTTAADPATGADASGPRFNADTADTKSSGADSAETSCSTSVECADSNPCTLDSCVQGKCQNAAATCDDGNACTMDGACQNVEGKAVCNYTPLPDLNQCDDGNPGTLNTCKGGQCVVVTAPACKVDTDCPSTGKECWKHTCNVELGKCVTVVDNDAECDDNDACTGSDQCQNGACAGGSPVNCEDGDPCTINTCSKISGCAKKPVTCTGTIAQCLDKPMGILGQDMLGKCFECFEDSMCDDMAACTFDKCEPTTGKCSHTAGCNDGSACTNDACDLKAGTCVNKAKNCSDGNPCTDDLCSFVSGACSYVTTANAAKVCDDKDACTVDLCDLEFGCKHTATVCSDNNVCTDDACNSTSGCAFLPNNKKCDDNDACTINEECIDGACDLDTWGMGDYVSCFDGNSCTKDTCDAKTGNCSHMVLSGSFCSDGDFCTVGESCKSGVCASGAPKVCDDLNPCTFDVCDSWKDTCVFSPVQTVNKACTDADECTAGDFCSGGTCIGVKKVCNDNNACTLDACDPKKGCVTADNSKMCDDGNTCTLDSCDPIAACKLLALSGNTCDDGKADTFNDVCQVGACKGTPKIPCTQASDCGDNNPCTTNTCDQAKGCLSTPNTVSCKDSNVCNGDEICKDGACSAGTPIVCNDGNACTTDGCDLASGCTFTSVAVGVQCTSGNQCTKDDACSADGKCVAGPQKSCDDNNPCTADSCAPSVGCQNLPIAGCVPPNVCLRWSNPSAASKITLDVNACVGTYSTSSSAFFCEEAWAKKATKTDMSAAETFTWCLTVPSGKAVQVSLSFDPCIFNETVGYCSKNSPAGKGKDAGLVLDLVGKHELSLDGGKTYTPIAMSSDAAKTAFVVPNGSKDGGNLVLRAP